MSPAAPIVLLEAEGEALPEAVAPGMDRLGFMLPYTPLHHLMLRRMERPVVMTSGNISGQPQCISNTEVREKLAHVADFALLNDRAIANRTDDSVARVDLGRSRLLRRARGYAPAPLPMPGGLEKGEDLVALGGELKNTFCLAQGGRAIVSQHLGDLEDADTLEEAGRALALYRQFYGHEARAVVVDRHPEYLSTKRGRAMAAEEGLRLIEVQHHHAHVAACLADNGRPADASPVVGVVMDGLGLGDDGTIWGGEFLVGNYRGYRRAGLLKPVAMPGGAAAAREPWRNAYAHLMAEMGWAELKMNFAGLALFDRLAAAPRATLDAMIAKGVNAPLASSCGRLFDAAATIAGLAWEAQSHEGEAAMRLEAAIDPAAMEEPEDLAYPFAIPRLGGRGLPYIEPLAVWRAMLGDLILETPPGVMAARFHRGLAKAIATLAARIARAEELDSVALTGGCFQNATLLRLVDERLRAEGLAVLSHENVPANDGGLALGQAAVGRALMQQGG